MSIILLMDTASPTPTRITVRVRGGIESGHVIWRRAGKIRVALRTGKVRTFDESAERRPGTSLLTVEEAASIAKLRAREDEVFAREFFDFSVETMGFCFGVHMAPMFAKRWP